MVKIVTGRINSFKSTRLESYYKENQLGDGFIAKKIMKDSLVYGYNLQRLSTGEEIPFIIRDIYLDESNEIIYKLGPYCFYKRAFIYLDKMIDEFIKNRISPVYLDEIGVLELNGQGFDQIINRLIQEDIDLCLVVRSDLLDKVCERYGFNEVEII
jgi:nucleoside-triphosphatase THEP1